MLNKLIADAVKAVPEVMPLLSDRARFIFNGNSKEYKSAEYFLSQVNRLVSSLYNGYIGGNFIDLMANLISGQLYDAYYQAFQDEEGGKNLPDYLDAAWQSDVLNQYNFVDQFYRDIIDAKIDQTGLDPLLARAAMWANRWNESYNNAVALITENNGGNLMWVYGDTDHCDTCLNLNGIVASKKDWDTAGVKPQNAQNDMLDCGGWRCKCSLVATDKRRSPKALDTILNIVVKL
jgi:hypothetical protein